MPETTDTQNQPALIKEYEQPLTPEEAWEEQTATKEDPTNILVTGDEARKQIAKYEWENSPPLWQLFLDPRRVPCLRETLMTGIAGGFFGLGLSAVILGLRV